MVKVTIETDGVSKEIKGDVAIGYVASDLSDEINVFIQGDASAYDAISMLAEASKDICYTCGRTLDGERLATLFMRKFNDYEPEVSDDETEESEGLFTL